MKIEMNTIYHLPTQAHEDDFLKQADKQEIKWVDGSKATQFKKWNSFKEEHCICLKPLGMGWGDKSFYETNEFFNSLPIIEWKIGFTKADMQIGQRFRMRNGVTSTWTQSDINEYTDDLLLAEATSYARNYDIIEVYPSITPIWKREEPKYRVKTELTKEQAEKLGLEFCEEV